MHNTPKLIPRDTTPQFHSSVGINSENGPVSVGGFQMAGACLYDLCVYIYDKGVPVVKTAAWS